MDRVLELNPGDYQACASNRWIELRSNILSYESLSASFENLFNQLTDNKVYERESLVWDNYSFGQDDLNYTLTWLQERLCFLDSYFGFDQECQFTPLFDLSTVPMCATPNDTFTTTLAYDYQGKTPAWIDTIAVTADSDEGFEIISYSPTEIQSGRNEITVSVVYTGNCSESNVFICDVVGGGGAADCSQLVSSPIPCCCGDADTDSDGIFNDCDNCPTTANPDQADQNGNGIGDLCEGTSQFVSYPNPTDGNIRISAVNHNKSLNGLNPLYNLKLIDSNGQIVRNQNIENDEFEIETSDLQPGIYFLQIKDGNNNFVGREKIMILE